MTYGGGHQPIKSRILWSRGHASLRYYVPIIFTNISRVVTLGEELTPIKPYNPWSVWLHDKL